MKVITLFNQKGGVGKSSLTFNLAYYFSLNYRTIMWDLDTQKALSIFTGVFDKYQDDFDKVFKNNKKINEHIYKTEWENLFIIPSNDELRNIILELDSEKKSKKVLSHISEKIENDFDYMFIDSRPSKSLLVDNILRASDYIFIPIIPNQLNYALLKDNIDFIDSCKSLDKLSGIICNNVDHRKKMHSEVIEKIKKYYNNYYLEQEIVSSSKMDEMQLKMKPLELFAKSSKITQSLRELYRLIHSRI